MFAVITPEKIQLPPGAVVRLPSSWDEYQRLSQKLGDRLQWAFRHRTLPRIKYRPGEIILMVPLPEDGRKANLLADIVKVLLDHLEQEYESFTPITMELPLKSEIEPDYCFYIDNWPAIAGKDRIDWQNDPPPDLVIEIDVTSYTDINDYLPYKVPEIWLFKKNQLLIYGLQGDNYQIQTHSRYFPLINLLEIINNCFQIANERNSSFAIRELRRNLSIIQG